MVSKFSAIFPLNQSVETCWKRKTGWWFGTFGLFFHFIYGMSSFPIDELICFKMVETTNLLSTIMNYIISIIINHEINSILTIYKPSSITGKTQPCSIWPFLQASKRSDLARSTSDGAYAVYAPWLVGGFDWQRSPLVVGKNWSWPLGENHS